MHEHYSKEVASKVVRAIEKSGVKMVVAEVPGASLKNILQRSGQTRSVRRSVRVENA